MFVKVGDKEIRIAHCDKKVLHYRKANVFVKGLNYEVSNIVLYNLFKSCGNVFSSRIAQDIHGQSKGYGFVQFVYEADAIRAIKEMNGKVFMDKKLTVEPYKSKADLPVSFKNVYIKNLPLEINCKEKLREFMGIFGEITSAVMFDNVWNGVKGHYGFVNFVKGEDAARACKELHGKQLGGTILYVVRALSKEQREREKERLRIESIIQARKVTLHIKSASESPLSEDFVRKELEQFGELKQVSIRKREFGEGGESVNLPIGFAVYSAEEQAVKAVTYYPKNGPLIINRLEGREERIARIEKLRSQRPFDYAAAAYPPYMRLMMGMQFPGLIGPRPRCRPPCASRRPRPPFIPECHVPSNELYELRVVYQANDPRPRLRPRLPIPRPRPQVPDVLEIVEVPPSTFDEEEKQYIGEQLFIKVGKLTNEEYIRGVME